jgi:hypothetical protein
MRGLCSILQQQGRRTEAMELKFFEIKRHTFYDHKNEGRKKYGTLKGHLPTIMNKSPNFKGVYAYS